MKFLMIAMVVLMSIPAHARTKEFEDIVDSNGKVIGKRKIIKDKNGNIKKAVDQMNNGGPRNVVKFQKGSGTTYDSATIKSFQQCIAAGGGQMNCQKFKGADAAGRIQSNKDWHAKDAAEKAEKARLADAQAGIQKAMDAEKVAMEAGAKSGGYKGCWNACLQKDEHCEATCKQLAPVETALASEDAAKKAGAASGGYKGCWNACFQKDEQCESDCKKLAPGSVVKDSGSKASPYTAAVTVLKSRPGLIAAFRDIDCKGKPFKLSEVAGVTAADIQSIGTDPAYSGNANRKDCPKH